MNIQDKILGKVRQKGLVKTTDLAELFGVSRQYMSRQLSDLVKRGELMKAGSTNKAVYGLPGVVKAQPNLFEGFRKTFQNQNLKEHEVFEEVEQNFPVILHLPENVRSILEYAFSEMCNNAIEHSRSGRIKIEVSLHKGQLLFVVEDFGVGVFGNVMKKRGLKTELAAVQDLLKGKVTTQPKAHSGEGIFFTSKVGDLFILESHKLRLRVDNGIPDVFLEELSRRKLGTKVTFQISQRSQRHLIQVFNKFASPDDENDYGFNTTEVLIKLYIAGGIHVSRSQARRVLAGLEKFKSITFDFDQVPMVGQAFADEIFRVFQAQHPQINLQAVRMNEAVKFMVKRVGK